MRRNHRAVPFLALTCALFAVLAAPAAAQKPDLVVSSSAEPPDSAIADGNDFLVSFTVDNQGRRRAGRSLSRAYLSVGRVLSADDRRRRVGSRRTSALRPGRSQTRRLTVEIPPAFRLGEYYLIVCADVRNQVDETNDRANCHVSGQKIQVVSSAEEAARRGPAGPAGPAGPPGPPGGSDSVIRIPRKTLSLGTATLLSPENDGPGDNEGSTEQFDLAEVGGVRIRALCVSTTNGDNATAGTDADEDGVLDTDNDYQFDEDGDEAKILLYLDRPEGNFSFAGPHGKRFNIGPGFGFSPTSYQRGPDGPSPGGDTGGDGKHMAIATAADPESRIAGDADDTDDTVGSDDTFEPRDDWEQAFRNGSIYVATSSGTEFILDAYAGVGVLGSAPDQCTFGGSITVVNR